MAAACIRGRLRVFECLRSACSSRCLDERTSELTCAVVRVLASACLIARLRVCLCDCAQT
eukprot:5291405-Pleurochrysis_carterae.AAC.4